MPEFTQSWAFIFIVGVIGFVLGFILAIIMAASGKASRMEEKIEKDLASRPIVWNVKNHFKSVGYKPPLKAEIVIKNNPRTD